jgi:alginate O-acetyltransferase complex protein AlgI
MLFNSVEFLVFLLLVVLVHFVVVPRRCWRARKAVLVAASYLFYMNWNPFFGLLLLTSTLCDFGLGLAIEGATSRARRRLYVAVSVCVNLGILGFFKYGAFLARTATAVLTPLIGPHNPPLLDVLLPIGISFYTFESLSYTIDVYRGMPASRSLLDFALFLSFFPHLVAGPIVRPAAFLPQTARAPRVRGPDVEAGLARIATGLMKKVMFADALGTYVDVVFGAPDIYGGANALLAVYAYAFQIYFDFSGYTDMALGLATLFGFSLPENFDRPYLASGPRDFWRRWHISLSTWLRDYLYVPLGGNRRGLARTYVNLFLTMLLGGLWHGAAWTFVLWGGYHGVLLAAERALVRDRVGRVSALAARVPLVVKRLVTFHLVCLGWVLFRAPSLAVADALLRAIESWRPFVLTRAGSLAAALVSIAALLHVARPGSELRRWLVARPPWLQGLAYVGVAVVVFLFTPATTGFIYFQF